MLFMSYFKISEPAVSTWSHNITDRQVFPKPVASFPNCTKQPLFASQYGRLYLHRTVQSPMYVTIIHINHNKARSTGTLLTVQNETDGISLNCSFQIDNATGEYLQISSYTAPQGGNGTFPANADIAGVGVCNSRGASSGPPHSFH